MIDSVDVALDSPGTYEIRLAGRFVSVNRGGGKEEGWISGQHYSKFVTVP